jgi:hypothetical protein
MKNIQAVLDLFDIAPMTAEERTVLRDEWFKRALENILTIACMDKSLATQLKEKTDEFFRKPQGRQTKWDETAHRILLIHYALYMQDSDNDHQKAIVDLIDYVKRWTGAHNGPRTINNIISNALGEPGIIETVPDFLQPILRQRKAMGEKRKGNKSQ